MKHLLVICAVFVILFSCKKEIKPKDINASFFEKIQSQLKDSLVEQDYQEMDFENAVLNKFNGKALPILRIPFVNKDFKNDFILLRIEQNGTFSFGKIVSLKNDRTDSTSKTQLGFDGSISIYTLRRKLTTNSPIKNGYVETFHSTTGNFNGKPLVVPVRDPTETLPEVILVSSYPSDGGWTSTPWYNLQSIFGESNTLDGGAAGEGGGGDYHNSNSVETSGNTDTPRLQLPMHVDFESANQPAIDVTKYIKCFGDIPDNGATCTVKILADIPVDKNPNVFFNWESGSPGHSFIQITKSNGGKMIQQNIGFYPDANWKDVSTTAPIAGKFVDNAGHEFNASLSMNLTPEKFQNTLTHILSLARSIKYDLDENNCTDFALQVFNYQRGGNQLTIPMYDIPGGTAVGGTSTPQGLYIKLKEMKDQPDTPDANNITIPGVKGFAGDSHGPCN